MVDKYNFVVSYQNYRHYESFCYHRQRPWLRYCRKVQSRWPLPRVVADEELARAIKYELERVRIEAHLLVPEDEDIDLATRCRRANALCTAGRNAVLVSLHSNAAGSGDKWHTASGWSVFVALMHRRSRGAWPHYSTVRPWRGG